MDGGVGSGTEGGTGGQALGAWRMLGGVGECGHLEEVLGGEQHLEELQHLGRTLGDPVTAEQKLCQREPERERGGK